MSLIVCFVSPSGKETGTAEDAEEMDDFKQAPLRYSASSAVNVPLRPP